MRKIIIITLFAISAVSYGQLIPGVVASSHYEEGSIFCAEYQLVYNAMVSKPTASIASAQNKMVTDLVSGGLWAKLNVFFVFANETNDNSEALIDWINPTNLSILEGSPTFISLQGFTGDGVDDCINTQFVPATDGGALYLASAANIGIYLRLDQNVNTVAFGTGTNTYLRPRSSGYANAYLHSTSGTSAISDNSSGLWVVDRPNADSLRVYHNGLLFDSELKSQNTSLPSSNLYYLSQSSGAGFSTNEVSIGFAGAYLSSSEIALLNAIVETYMDAIGKGVQP